MIVLKCHYGLVRMRFLPNLRVPLSSQQFEAAEISLHIILYVVIFICENELNEVVSHLFSQI